MTDTAVPVPTTTTIDAVALGAFLRTAREEKDWSRWNVAIATQVRETTIFRIETGRSLPGLDLFVRLLEVLGLKIDEVLEAEGVTIRG